MQGDIVSSLILPLGLAFIMFGLGIGLTFADFERVFRYHARGDVALAVSFTAFAGLVSILTVPAIVGWSYVRFMGAEQTIAFPYGQVMALGFSLAFLVRAPMRQAAKAAMH
jgi:BASS family bile acid:Na+ symporter